MSNIWEEYIKRARNSYWRIKVYLIYIGKEAINRVHNNKYNNRNMI